MMRVTFHLWRPPGSADDGLLLQASVLSSASALPAVDDLVTLTGPDGANTRYRVVSREWEMPQPGHAYEPSVKLRLAPLLSEAEMEEAMNKVMPPQTVQQRLFSNKKR